MASNAPLRVCVSLSKPFRRRSPTLHLDHTCTTSHISCLRSNVRHLSTTPSPFLHSTENTPDASASTARRPRWSQTPPQMVAPIRSRPVHPLLNWSVNEDPEVLDKAYIRFFGPGGDDVLTEEVKWLAVTHKSFDHGRRGYNDRLAFLGRRIVTLQASLSLLATPPQASNAPEAAPNPFAHPSLENLPSLTPEALKLLLSHKRLAALARRNGLLDVIRWVPRQRSNLETSGVDVVLAETLFAIVGAVALQRGGAEAKKVARERILAPLGME